MQPGLLELASEISQAMPWELSSVLSRLRHPVRRHTDPDLVPAPLPDIPSQHPKESSHTPQLRINQKILQDPSAYMDVGDRDPFPHGLTPSTRRQSTDGSSKARLKSERAVDRSEYPDASSTNIPTRTQSGLITRMSKIAAGGEWSTFGRNREHRVTDPSGFSGRTSPPDNLKRISHSPSPGRGNKHLRAESTPSTFTLSRLTNPSRPSTDMHAVHSSPSTGSHRHSPDNHVSSKRSSPTNTMSSRHPRTPERTRSYAGPSHASSVTNFITPVTVTRDFGLDSPHTFGYPTPLDNPSSVSFTYSSPPPPMPPLDHPELAGARSSRRRSTVADRPASAALRDRSNTLPGRLLRRDDLFPSISLTFGPSLRHHSSLPQAQPAFKTVMPEQVNTRARDSPRGVQRARTISTGARQRRSSAEWSSHQATVGVNSHANQAWPAEVSRAILRLSLGAGLDLSPGVRSPGSVPGSSNDKKRSRGDKLPDQATTTSPSFLPFPHPSRPSSPAPLKESATLADSRQPIPPRPHSLQFNLGNSKGNEQLGRSMLAEVKRSSSVVESRNGPSYGSSAAKHASSGLSDPALTSSKAPLASPFLHPSSAFKPPSARTLFPSPTPNNNIASTPMQSEPSTPTPVPRQLSDKSRGKRKAEDVDVTPPEQKKEGQRATFVLPSENRSQRISNSSHAPSSYHRKRARLSATSPFATPIQSRAPSLQDTPQSGSRSHHFSSLSSTTGARVAQPPRTPSRAESSRSRQPQSSAGRHHERHQSMSQVSIPISALISPHAPSVSKSTKFHMRDPRRPPKKPDHTEWGLRLGTEEEPGSPIHAWCFFFGFLLFPVWWMAALFLRVPMTRVAGDVDAEKAVHIDDPQIEHDARSWRFRCRVMAVVSLFTYIPFIVLIAIFVPR